MDNDYVALSPEIIRFMEYALALAMRSPASMEQVLAAIESVHDTLSEYQDPWIAKH